MMRRKATMRTGTFLATTAMLALLIAPVASSAETWRTKARVPKARDEVGYVQVGGKLYQMGKTKAVYIYDPVANAWSTGKPMPSPVNLNHIQLVAIGTKIYAIGGLNKWKGEASAAVYIYDTTKNSWTTGAPMRAARGAGGVAVHDGKIYYAGGMTSATATPRFDVYDPVANTWTQLDPMPRPREHFQAVVAAGKLWAIGGRNVKVNNTIGQTDAYDFATGRWQTGFAPIPTQRGGYAAGVVGGEIVVMGGERGGIARPEVQAYDPVDDAWRSLGSMPVPRHGLQAASCNGGLYLAGGGTDQGGGHATTYHDVFFAGSPTTCGGGGSGP